MFELDGKMAKSLGYDFTPELFSNYVVNYFLGLLIKRAPNEVFCHMYYTRVYVSGSNLHKGLKKSIENLGIISLHSTKFVCL